jgi:hypothetical protein
MTAPATATTAAAYRSALGSVVKGTVAVGTIMDVVSDSVSMLGNFVKEHAQRQQINQDIDREIWLENIEHDSTIRLAEISAQALDYCNKSENHKTFYTNANARIEAILKSHKPSTKNEAPE